MLVPVLRLLEGRGEDEGGGTPAPELLIELERELGFRFRADEASGLKNVGELIDVIETKLT